MIVYDDIPTIIQDKMEAAGIVVPICRRWDKLKGKLAKEVAVIIATTPVTPGIYWEDAAAHINWCVPDYLGEEDTIRLTDVERLLDAWIKGGVVDVHDGTWYKLEKTHMGSERDEALQCSYVNLIIDFKILNVN